MTWTVTKEESAPLNVDNLGASISTGDKFSIIPSKLNVRAIIDVDNDQAELKDLIASLQKHVKEEK